MVSACSLSHAACYMPEAKRGGFICPQELLLRQVRPSRAEPSPTTTKHKHTRTL
jgi:hypothetical protein